MENWVVADVIRGGCLKEVSVLQLRSQTFKSRDLLASGLGICAVM